MRYQKPRFTYIQVMCDSLYNSCHKVFLNWIKEVLNDAIKIVSFVRYRCYRTDYFPYAVMKFSDPIITFFCIQKLNACQEMTFFSVSLRSKIKCNFMLRIINKLYLNNRMWNMTFNFVTAVIFLKKINDSNLLLKRNNGNVLEMSDEIYAFLKASHLGRINVSQKREHYRKPLALVTSLWCCYKTPRSNHPSEPKRKIPVIILAWYRFLSKRIHKKNSFSFRAWKNFSYQKIPDSYGTKGKNYCNHFGFYEGN